MFAGIHNCAALVLRNALRATAAFDTSLSHTSPAAALLPPQKPKPTAMHGNYCLHCIFLHSALQTSS
jgi:hypothetical protein